jgi:hypothetical protein
VRGLHEQANPRHRLRVEHNEHTRLIHLSDEDGGGWTAMPSVSPGRLSCLISHPQVHQAAEVRDEPLLLVRRIRRPDRVHE